tara:strand:+ start:238 stop:909 length:672 start_codon:yes stop_codon:yes gene_type:complete
MVRTEEEKKAYQKAYYQAHKTKLRENQTKYRATHKEEKAITDKKYREKHKVKLAADKKAYGQKNKVKIAATNKEMYEKNKVKILAQKKVYREKNKDALIAYRSERKEHIAVVWKDYYENKKEELAAKQKIYGQTPQGKKRYTVGNWKKRGATGDLKGFYDKIYLPTTKCQVCKTKFKPTRDKCMDHDHLSGEIRFVLCRKCNCHDFWKKHIAANRIIKLFKML